LLIFLPFDASLGEPGTLRSRLIVYGVHTLLTIGVLVVSFLPIGQRHTDALATIFALGVAANALAYFYAAPTAPTLIVSALTCLLVGTAVLAAWSSRRAMLVCALVWLGFLAVGLAVPPERLPRTDFLYALNALLLGAAVAVVSAEILSTARERLAHRQQELAALSGRLMSLQEEERRRLSRELHDQVGQSLTAVISYLWLVDRGLDHAATEPREHLGEARRLAAKTLSDIRELSQLLRPSVLDDWGLGPSLEAHVEAFGRRHEIATGLTVDGLPERLPPEFETAVYRITQEALTNVARHAKASRVDVNVRADGTRLLLVVADDGIGLGTGAARPAGMGLIGIRERVLALGGTMSLRGDKGTELRVDLPLPSPRQLPAEPA
ncbi:MAG TPA: sensor histidine kinase, partial [Planctomycetota bacterium]|nr:sensor histidine kinase [Planctomycetota bacterium]